MESERDILSVQVILRSASGKSLDGDIPITSDNLHEFLPAPRAYDDARAYFSRRGFEVGPLVGVSFSITAPARRFDEVFGVTLGGDETRQTAAMNRGQSALPLDRLSAAVRRLVSRVVFSETVDYGPV